MWHERNAVETQNEHSVENPSMYSRGAHYPCFFPLFFLTCSNSGDVTHANLSDEVTARAQTPTEATTNKKDK